MTENRIRVLCVDDNELVAQAVERRMAFEPRFEWVGWVSRTEELLETVSRAQPHVVLLDIDMPGRSAFDVVKDLADAAPDTRVVMFSGYVRNDYIDRSVDAGAWGYVSKNASIEELLEAIEKVAGGNFALTDEVIAQQARGHRASGAAVESPESAGEITGG